MFEKLLANLPYNPNLIKQIAFYTQRLKREESIRRIGLICMVLAFTLQFFAFLSPPQPTTANSSSDMITGGINSKAEAIKACRDNVKKYKDILWNFKIDCGDVANATVTNIKSTDFDGRLFSLGWLPYGQTNPHSGSATDETPLNIAKVSDSLYARRLASADTIPFSTYKVLQGSANSRTFYIMFGGGNLVLVGVPNPAEVCRKNGEVYYKGDDRCKPDVPTLTPVTTSLIPSCPYDGSISKDSLLCKPCTTVLSSPNDQACIIEHKAASNVTQGINDANNSLAQPNDVIVYTLFAENHGKKEVNGFVMQENLSDVLDYADIVDLGGGNLATSGLVSWPTARIKPSVKLSHKITVRVKNSLPTNSPPAADPNHYDHVMTNVYGNTVTVKLPLPASVAPIAATSQVLPKIGPGANITIIFLIIMGAGYFLARSRLLVDESMMVLQETKSGRL